MHAFICQASVYPAHATSADAEVCKRPGTHGRDNQRSCRRNSAGVPRALCKKQPRDQMARTAVRSLLAAAEPQQYDAGSTVPLPSRQRGPQELHTASRTHLHHNG